MDIGSVFTNIGSGLGEFVPAFFKALLDGFTSIFLTTTTVEGVASVSLSPVGIIAIVFIVIGITYKLAPTVMGLLRVNMKGGKGRKKKAK